MIEREPEVEDPRALLAAKLAHEDDALRDFVQRLRAGHGDEIMAIVFYGSLLSALTRRPSSFHDFYVIVESLPAYFARWRDRAIGRILPPSVYYQVFENPGGPPLRCKICVLTADQFRRELSPAARDIHNVGRFSKRVGVVHARDEAAYALIVDGCLQAARTLRPHALALLPERFSLDEFIRMLLRLSYLGEQRVAEDSKVDGLMAAELGHYRRLYGAILAESPAVSLQGGLYAQAAPPPAARRKTERFLARSRRRGKMRWPKYIVTVDNWLEIVIEKIERHHGVRIELSARERRWPLLFGWPKYFALKRRGVVK